MINTNIQRSNSNHTLASQAKGHEFDPRLPLLKRRSLIITKLTDNQERFSFIKKKYFQLFFSTPIHFTGGKLYICIEMFHECFTQHNTSIWRPSNH